MGLFDKFKKPKWESDDPQKRIEGISELDDKETLISLARNDSNSDVRNEAIKKIDDEATLADIIKNESNKMVCESAFEKISDDELLKDIARNASDWPIRSRAVEMIDDEDTLKDISRSDSNEFVREAAIRKISDKEFLSNLVQKGSDNEKLSALGKLAKMNELGNNIFVLFNLSNSATRSTNDIANSILKDIEVNEISLDSDITIPKPIKIGIDNFSIDGNGHSISGDEAKQWIEISANNVSLKNITFKNFSNYGHGGVIRNTGKNLTIENCNFIENQVEKYDSNDSERFGGVIDNGGTLKIVNSNFKDNKADSGGCIHTENGTSELEGCTFEDNFANLSGGGALSVFKGDIKVSDCIFKGNKSRNFSGAIRLTKGNGEIENSQFIENYADSHGGAISVGEGELKISNSSFLKNSGMNGGAINQPDGSLILRDCTFNDNVSRNGAEGAVFTNGNIEESNNEFKSENDAIYTR